MRRTLFALIAVVSAFATIEAARRPRYGGELRIETIAAPRLAEPGAAPFLDDVFEPLVRIDEHGEPKPWLATQWTHDPAKHRWIFTARTAVALHGGGTWSPAGGIVAVPDDRPIDVILRDLARPTNAVAVRGADGTLAGTGPFRVARWDAEKSATLAAHDGYWGGRSYLDSVAIQMGRALKDQAVDLEVGKTDAIELSLTDVRRFKQRGTAIVVSRPSEAVVLVFENAKIAAGLREAVALSIDRAAISSVLLQKQGEASAALLPQWMSGYAFLFPATRDVARARTLAGTAATLTFAFDKQDAVMRAIGERIAVNAGEAGISLKAFAGAADVRLVRLAPASRNALAALEDQAAILKLPWPREAANAAANPYDVELALLEGHHVIPIVQLPQAWAVSGRVRAWGSLASVWIDVDGKP